jgi:hypothetical protein
MITLNLNLIKDEATKQALEQLVEQLNAIEVLKGGYVYVEYTFPQSTSGIFRLNHGLKFKPADIIELHRASTLTAVTYDINLSTPTTVYLTVTGSGVLRFLVGKQKRG